MPRHTLLALALTLALPSLAISSVAVAQSSPQAPVYAASTTPYPGTIALEVDATNLSQRVFAVKQRIPVSAGEPVETVDDAVAAADRVGYPVVVKAQVLVGGRGKAGGIKLANDAAEVRTHAGNILGMDIKGHVVQRLWIEHASDIAEEYYASFTLDRGAKQHLGMLSAQGGVDIEQVADENPDAIARIHIDPVEGLTEAACRAWVAAANARTHTSSTRPSEPSPRPLTTASRPSPPTRTWVRAWPSR